MFLQDRQIIIWRSFIYTRIHYRKGIRECINNYHDEAKSQGCVVLLSDWPIKLFEEGTLKLKVYLLLVWIQLVLTSYITCWHYLKNTWEVRYQPTENSPSFPMASEVRLDKFEFLHMFDHLRTYRCLPNDR